MISHMKKVIDSFNIKEEDIISYYVSNKTKKFKIFIIKIRSNDDNIVFIGFKIDTKDNKNTDDLLDFLNKNFKNIKSDKVIDDYIWYEIFEDNCGELSYFNFINRIENICSQIMEE